MVALPLLYTAVGALFSWHGLIGLCDSRLAETALCQTMIAQTAVAPWAKLHAANLFPLRAPITAPTTSSPRTITIAISQFQQAETLAPSQPQGDQDEEVANLDLRTDHQSESKPVMVRDLTWLDVATLPPVVLFLGVLAFSLAFAWCQGGFWTLAPRSRDILPPVLAVVKMSRSGSLTQESLPVSSTMLAKAVKTLLLAAISSQDTVPVPKRLVVPWTRSAIMSCETVPVSSNRALPAVKPMSRSAIMSIDTAPTAAIMPAAVVFSQSAIVSTDTAPIKPAVSISAATPKLSLTTISFVDTAPVKATTTTSSATQTTHGVADGMRLVKESDLVEVQNPHHIRTKITNERLRANIRKYFPDNLATYDAAELTKNAKTHLNKRLSNARKNDIMARHNVSWAEVDKMIAEEVFQQKQDDEDYVRPQQQLWDDLVKKPYNDPNIGRIWVLMDC